MRRRHAARITAVAAMFLAILTVGRAMAAPPGSPWGAHYFPNVPLITHEGKTVRFYDDLLKDKVVAITVIYTRCKDACPLITARLAQVQHLLGDRVGRDLFFYAISIDPTRDTPEVLKAYAEKFHVGPGWLFLTGKPADIERVRKKLGLASLDDALNPDGHQPSLMLGNEATGQWMRQSAVDNPQFLATKINTLLGNWTGGRSYAEARPLTLDPGEYLFRSLCGACHTLGKGEKVGPDLLGVTTRRDRGWLVRYVTAPDRMLAETDPIAMELFAKYKSVRMPNLRLADDDVETLIKYLEAQTVVQPNSAAAPESPRGRAAAAQH